MPFRCTRIIHQVSERGQLALGGCRRSALASAPSGPGLDSGEGAGREDGDPWSPPCVPGSPEGLHRRVGGARSKTFRVLPGRVLRVERAPLNGSTACDGTAMRAGPGCQSLVREEAIPPQGGQHSVDLIGAMNQRHAPAQTVGHSRRVDEGIYPRPIHIRNPIQVDQESAGTISQHWLELRAHLRCRLRVECPGERNSHGLGFSRNLNRQPRIENSRHDLAPIHTARSRTWTAIGAAHAAGCRRNLAALTQDAPGMR